MDKNSIVIVGVLALFALSGCERADSSNVGGQKGVSTNAVNKAESATVSQKSTTLSSLPDSAVIIKVGDVGITKQDYHAYLKMVEALYKNRHPSYPMEKIKAAAARHRMSAISELLSRSLMKIAFGKVKSDRVAFFREELQAQYVKKFCHKGQKFSELRSVMFDENLGTFFDKCFEEDVIVRSGMFASHSNELTVTEADMQAARQRMASYNKRASATNALIHARMEKVVKEIAAGADFAKLAKEYTMSKDDGDNGDMGECTLSDFSDESDEYKTAVARLKTGDVSDVLETTTGYDILKAVEYIPKEKSSTDSPTWHLQRIQFEKPFFFDESQTDEELHKDLEKEKRDALLEELTPKLRDLVKIEFPYGYEIFEGKQGNKPKPGRRPFPMNRKQKKGTRK